MNIRIVTLFSFISAIPNKLLLWVWRLAYFRCDATVPISLINQHLKRVMETEVPWYGSVPLQDTGLGSANPLGSWGSRECAEGIGRKGRGKGRSWKLWVHQHNGFPSTAGALPKASWLSLLLTGGFTVEGNKEKGVVRLKQWNAFLINSTETQLQADLVARNGQARSFQGDSHKAAIKNKKHSRNYKENLAKTRAGNSQPT